LRSAARGGGHGRESRTSARIAVMPSRATRAAEPRGRVTKADIAAKLREATGELDEEVEHGRRIGPWVVGAAAVIVLAYRIGIRRGSRHSTMLEIRRITPT
jgi:hypothetical protein